MLIYKPSKRKEERDLQKSRSMFQKLHSGFSDLVYSSVRSPVEDSVWMQLWKESKKVTDELQWKIN
jgi:hypothetical protein